MTRDKVRKKIENPINSLTEDVSYKTTYIKIIDREEWNYRYLRNYEYFSKYFDEQLVTTLLLPRKPINILNTMNTIFQKYFSSLKLR